MHLAKLLPVIALLAPVPLLPGAAIAQRYGTAIERTQNARASADMRSRLAEAVDRVRVTDRHGKIAPARSAALRRQLGQAQREMARLSRRQGFVSAAELASYGRLVDEVDAELAAGAVGQDLGHDGLPGPEVTAFRRTDARLHYRDARIGYGVGGCAFYEGMAPDGKVRHERLLDPAGKPLCPRR